MQRAGCGFGVPARGGVARIGSVAPPAGLDEARPDEGSAVPDLSTIVKAYDIRGVVGEQLDAAVVRDIGAAFAELVRDPEGSHAVVVGYDMRESSPGLAGAVAGGGGGRGVAGRSG